MVFDCGHLPPDLVCLCPWSLNLDHYKEVLFQEIFGLKQRERNSLKVSQPESSLILRDYLLGPELEGDFLVVCVLGMVGVQWGGCEFAFGELTLVI